MPSPSTDEPSASVQHCLTRRGALTAGSLALTGLTGCVGRLRDRLDPRTHHSDAAVGDPPDPWPTLGGNARRTGARATESTLSTDPTVERVAPAGAFTRNPPAVAGGLVFAPVATGGDAAASTGFVATEVVGPRRWRVAREQALTVPSVAGDTVFLTSAGLTAAVARESGQTHWTYAAGTGNAPPTVVGETVYVGGKRLVALDAVTGERRWRADAVPRWVGPTAATESAVFAESDGTLYALDTADGSVRWRTPAGAGTYATPVVGEDVVVVTESDATLRAVDRADGTRRWTVDLGQASQNAPAVADGTVYVVDDSADALVAVEAATGAERWRTDLGPVVSHRPVVGGESVYVQAALDDGNLGVVDAETGEVRRVLDLPIATASSVALGDRDCFVVGQDDRDRYGVYRVG